MTIPSLKSIKNIRYGQKLNPVRDWFIMLVFFAIIFAGVVAWNMRAFNIVANGGTIGSYQTKAPVVDDNSLNKLHDILGKRLQEKNKYIIGEYNYSDPSK